MINRGKFLPPVALIVRPPRRPDSSRPPPNLADRWLTSVITAPHVVLHDLLMWEDAVNGHVDCKVEIVYKKVSLRHSLH